MLVRDLGEFGLISRIKDRVDAATPSPGGDVGIGDDTASVNAGGVTTLLTMDAMVQDVHFTLETASWKDIGWKALATNLSDIAAMGGAPESAVVALGLPPTTSVDDIDAFYDGLLEAAVWSECNVVGGDIVSSPTLFVSIALTGWVPGTPMVRSAAKPGEWIGVTGSLGASAAGLAVLQGRKAKGRSTRIIRYAHLRPEPRLVWGYRMRNAGVRCAMDVSDGLVADLSKLCASSGCAARLETRNLPIDPAVLTAFPDEALDMALNGGEDYELLFSSTLKVRQAIPRGVGSKVSYIGYFIEGEPGVVTIAEPDGHEITVVRQGWDHFAP